MEMGAADKHIDNPVELNTNMNTDTAHSAMKTYS